MPQKSRRSFTIPPLAAQLFGVDLRSAAAFRMSLAAVVLLDLATRARDLSSQYTDAGILPRRVLLEEFQFLHDWPLCVHLMSGAWWGQALLFGISVLVAVALFIGYRTRLSTFLLWLLISSVQLRNLYNGHGADAQIRMVLLWAIFLPLGARWSVDAARHGFDSRAQEEAPWLSIGSLALLAQIFIIYAASGYAKLAQPQWLDGTAVAMSLDNEIAGTPLGVWLLQFPVLSTMLTYTVLAWELVGPFVLFLPVLFGPLRTLAVFGFALMHIGFHAGLMIGMFAYSSLAVLPVLLPAWFWERPQVRRLGRPILDQWQRSVVALAARLPERSGAASSPLRRSWIHEAISAVLLAYLLIWNVGVFRDPLYTAPPSIAWLGNSLFMQQDWRMFGRVATRTGWLVIPGKLRDGTAVDLIRAGGPLPRIEDFAPGETISLERPSRIHGRLAHYRWAFILDRLIFGKRGSNLALHYGRYLCRQWNVRYAEEKQLESFEIIFMARPVRSDYRTYATADYTQETVWTHGCFR